MLVTASRTNILYGLALPKPLSGAGAGAAKRT